MNTYDSGLDFFGKHNESQENLLDMLFLEELIRKDFDFIDEKSLFYRRRIRFYIKRDMHEGKNVVSNHENEKK